uniref:Putative alpha-L-fucosidase n=1 Tax=Timema poppense TaxID=170557 RepID=A0A7R9CSK2_TIMPO|nr:unnamed protein product [Timema poppensis]
MYLYIPALVVLVGSCFSQDTVRYNATWDSLDTRPLPQWYDDAKFGIFIHFGVFSVPSYRSEWFWSHWQSEYTVFLPPYVSEDDDQPEFAEFMAQNYPPNFTYQDFAPDLTAEFFDPDEWVEIIQASGAKYLVLTTKHHEGFALWPTKHSFGWNSKEVGPNRDIVGDLAASVRKTVLHLGLYHSRYEWFNPLYLRDKANNYETQTFVDQRSMPQLYELVNSYKPDIVWSDGAWESSTYWKATEFIAWLFNDSPVKDTVVVNDRWGTDSDCTHGSYVTCADSYNPGERFMDGVLQARKWESALPLTNNDWGYNREASLSDFLSIQELLTNLVKAVSTGGNLLLNVGPSKEGVMTPMYEERLLQIGSWLQINGEAIYATKPWIHQNDADSTNIWYTASKNSSAVYAISLSWPSGGQLALGSVTLAEDSEVTLLGNNGALQWTNKDDVVTVQLPDKDVVSSQWAWVLKLTETQALIQRRTPRKHGFKPRFYPRVQERLSQLDKNTPSRRV